MTTYTWQPGSIIAAVDPPPDRVIGAQFLFAWTRTVIEHVERLEQRPGNDDDGRPAADADAPARALDAKIDGTYVSIPVDAIGPFERNRRIVFSIAYRGEPLQPLGFSWFVNEAERFSLPDAIDHWLNCRAVYAAWDPAHAFFLHLDRETHPTLVGGSDPAWAADVVYFAMKLTDRLHERLNGVQNLFQLGIEHYQRVSNIMDQGLADCFGHDQAWAETAFERFAAGWLREMCHPSDPRLQTSPAADADSANIMLFAEFVLGILERREESAAWASMASLWEPYLNCFVRIQDIYLERWKLPDVHDPACFRQYHHRARPLPYAPTDIRHCYAQVGSDVAALTSRMLDNLEHVNQGVDCFDPFMLQQPPDEDAENRSGGH